MEEKKNKYICIDLKSFYASVECVERGLDPLNTNLVVADKSRTDKTICLAVSPSLKALGVPGRERLFIVNQLVKEINQKRKQKILYQSFHASSFFENELQNDPYLEVDFIIAPPRMAHYIEISTKIYHIYLQYVASEDIHVYSIDEVFIDVTKYLKKYHCTAEELAIKIIKEVYEKTGITATAGVGTNLYLAKVAMDIVAKHMKPNEFGVRMASLDEISYREILWDHRPLTDFWRIGRGLAQRLEQINLFTMGDIARCSLGSATDYYNEDLLYQIFGVNAELIIDHAWGKEPCTMKDIKQYQPENNSLGTGQVLSKGYIYEKGELIVKEMAESLSLDLVKKGLWTDCISLTLGYDGEILKHGNNEFNGEIREDYLGRKVPRHSHGNYVLKQFTSSQVEITEAALDIYRRIMNPVLLIRRIYLVADHVKIERGTSKKKSYEQLNLFSTIKQVNHEEKERDQKIEKEKKTQKAILKIKEKYGKNAVFKGRDLQEDATTLERNQQIGGHKA